MLACDVELAKWWSDLWVLNGYMRYWYSYVIDARSFELVRWFIGYVKDQDV